MSQIVIPSQWAGWYHGGTSDKIWAACYTDTGQYLAVWGRRGTKYQKQVKDLGTWGAGSRYFSKLAEKQREGYQRVEFNDPQHGMIPSFLSGARFAPVAAGQRPGTAGGQLTVAGVITRARAFLAAYRGARSDAAVARMVLEWKQIAGLVEVFLTIPTLAAPELEGLRGVLREMESLVLVGLSA